MVRAPLVFFDTTPSGRILNRFSKDIDMVDNTIPYSIKSFLGTFGDVVQVLLVISFSTPLFIPIILPFFAIYYFIQRFYIPTSRQLKRLESTTRSPILNHLSETLQGNTSLAPPLPPVPQKIKSISPPSPATPRQILDA